jgi:hypothetical protein
MAYVPKVSKLFLTIVVSSESDLGVRTTVMKEIPRGMDIRLGKAVERLCDGYPVEHHGGRLVPTMELFGKYVAMVFEPKTHGCLTEGKKHDDSVFRIAFENVGANGTNPWFTHGFAFIVHGYLCGNLRKDKGRIGGVV